MSDTGLSLLQSAVAVPKAAVGLYDLAVNTPLNAVLRNVGASRRLSASKALADIGYRPEETQQILQGMKSEQLQHGASKIDAAKGFTNTLKAYAANPANAVDDAVQSVFPSLAGGAAGRVAAAAVIAKNPMAIAAAEKAALTAGALFEGAQSSGDVAYQQSLKQGEILPVQAAADVAAGLGVGAISKYAGKLGNKVGLGDADVDLAMAGLRTGTKTPLAPTKYATRAATNTAKSALQEAGIEEPAQSVVEQAMKNLADGKPLDTDLGKAAAQGAVTAVPMGAHAGARKHVAENSLVRTAPKDTGPVAEIEAALQTMRAGQPEPVDAKAAAKDVQALNQNQTPQLPEPKEIADAKAAPDLSKVSDDQLKYLATQHPDPQVRAEVLNTWEARKLSPENFTLGDKLETGTAEGTATEAEGLTPATDHSRQLNLLGDAQQKDMFEGWQQVAPNITEAPNTTPSIAQERNAQQGELDLGTRRKAEWQKETQPEQVPTQQVETALPEDIAENRRLSAERDSVLAMPVKDALTALGVSPQAQVTALRQAQKAGITTGRDLVSAFQSDTHALSQNSLQNSPAKWAADLGTMLENKLTEWSYANQQAPQVDIRSQPGLMCHQLAQICAAMVAVAAA